MGLLTDDAAGDKELLATITRGVAEVWNQYGGKSHGFEVVPIPRRIARVCDLGGEILWNHFPRPPGVFKRLGALLGVGRIYPFFELRGLPKKGTLDIWQPRVLAMFISPVLGSLELDVSTEGHSRWVKLKAWEEFPSPHYKLEFLTLLEYIDARGWPEPHKLDEDHEGQLTRLVMGLSLIMEACYYCCEGLPKEPAPHHIRKKGPCTHKKNLDLTALSYDAHIYRQMADMKEAGYG